MTLQAKPAASTGGHCGTAVEIADPAAFATAAGLRYVSDTSPGIRRRRAGKGFVYTGLDGRPVRDVVELRRFALLGIPPAWTDVWICPRPNGHIQATGRDARGRKQYRYHGRWREVRDEAKYDRMLPFARSLPALRARIERDLALRGLPRERVLAAVVRLLDETLIRIGNEEYARQNESFGLTTLREEHADVEGTTIHFHFRGKSGKQHEIDVRDRRAAAVVKRCQDLPGHELFQYAEDGVPRTIESSDVNDYLREVTGEEFSAKDFRTWGGSVIAAGALLALGKAESETQARKNVISAIKQAAEGLGNTPAICRKCYVHPEIIDAYLEGQLIAGLDAAARQPEVDDLRPEEARLLAFLEARRVARASGSGG